MKMTEAAFLLFCLTSLVWSSMGDDVIKPNFNPETDGVVKLTQENFKTEVLNSDDAWLVDFEFPGPDCPYCIPASEVIKKDVQRLKEKNIKVGYVDSRSPEGKPLADTFEITRFPALYIYGRNKARPILYPFSPSSAKDFPGSVELFTKMPPAAEGRCGQNTVQNQDPDTYELTDENFEEVVLKCEEMWFVNFYIPDTTICNDFVSYFKEAAKEFKGQAKFGSFYQVGSKFAAKYQIFVGCPVFLFPFGNKDGSPVNYNNNVYHTIEVSRNLIPWIKTVLPPK